MNTYGKNCKNNNAIRKGICCSLPENNRIAIDFRISTCSERGTEKFTLYLFIFIHFHQKAFKPGQTNTVDGPVADEVQHEEVLVSDYNKQKKEDPSRHMLQHLW